MVAVTSGKILLTGASGYIGGWIVKGLVERNFQVVVAARNQAQIDSIIQQSPAYSGKVTGVIVPVIEAAGAYDEAVKGVDGIIHSASPVVFGAPDPQDVIKPAVEGATGILQSAAKYGKNVKRVVLTSSALAVSVTGNEGDIFDESIWNKDSPALVEAKGKAADGFSVYAASKTLAEEAAWESVKSNKPSFDLAAVLPVYNFGPFGKKVVKGTSAPSTVGMFQRTLSPGETSGKVAGDYVDVRDSALGHILALSTAEAGGERIILSHSNFTYQDLYDVLLDAGVAGVPGKDTYGKGKTAPSTPAFSNAKSLKIFAAADFKYRSLKETVIDMGNDLIAAGILGN